MASTRQRKLRKCALGIDVGGTNVRAGLYSQRDSIVRCLREARTQASLPARQSLAALSELVQQVVEKGRAAGLAPCNVGIGMPELIGHDGSVDTHCSLPWRAGELRALFRGYGKVNIMSDVIAASLAEARLGAGRGQPVFLYVTVGTGISCALVVDGKPYTGAHGHAISFASGSTAVGFDKNGRLDAEPLELRVSGPGILRRARDLGLKELDSIAICRSALMGPGAARTLIDEAATELAMHVAILANQLDPTLIVLGGGLGSAKGRYWSSFKTAFPKFTFGPHMRRLRLRRAQLGAVAGTIGAALFASSDLCS